MLTSKAVDLQDEDGSGGTPHLHALGRFPIPDSLPRPRHVREDRIIDVCFRRARGVAPGQRRGGRGVLRDRHAAREGSRER